MKIYHNVIAVGLLMAASAANADPVKIKAGAAGVVAAHGTVRNNSCDAGAVPQLQITAPPQHGMARATVLDGKSNNPLCKGVTFKYGVIVYKPAPGYRGPDSVTYGFEYDTYSNDTRKTWVSKTAEISVE